MASYSFDWVDAFTDRGFGGNPCVVVHDAEDVSLEDRLALVRETSLSECAYLVPSDRADFGVRYYLADREILFAGHPTVATIVSLVARGKIALDEAPVQCTLEVGSGVIPIEVARDEAGRPVVTMTQARPEFGRRHDPGAIAAIYGLSADEIVGTPQTVSTGTPFCIAVLASRQALDRAVLDPAGLQAFRAADGHALADLMEPFLVVREGATAAGDTYARLLLAPPLPAEDPFTGSATGCMAAYLWANGLIDRPGFIAEQGHGMGRPGRATVEVLGPKDDIAGIRVGGTGVVLMQGTLTL
ncbi:MAG: PhzF family phenazine biosynthesis protein [Pseudomonadota bacterium]